MEKIVSNLKSSLKSNKGFTLVELMIVLSIIAILAVVLVPKVGQMKDSVRNQGVQVNVNSVRAFLELNVGGRGTAVAAEETRLLGLLNAEFTSANGNLITNPFTNGSSIATWGTAVGNVNHSVAVYAWNTTYAAGNFAANGNYTTQTTRRGQVLIFILQDAYIVWGHNGTGTVIPFQVVR